MIPPRLLEPINKSSKGAGYKINVEKSLDFFYVPVMNSLRQKLKKTATVTAQNKIKPGINPTEEGKNFYSEN